MQQAFGYTQEDTKHYLLPMATTGQDPIGSMGRDTPIAVLSDKPKMLFDYFKQNFAQVTNPPIDPIREELVMSLVSLIGPRPNLLDPDHAGGQKRLEVRHPVLTNLELEKIRHIEHHVDSAFLASTLDITYRAENGAAGMEAALEKLFAKAEEVVKAGHNIIILSDRGVDAEHVAIPALLATAGVHHHLIRAGLRTDVGIVVETGEARRVHDFCLLAGYGAEAFNPYLALETVADMQDELGDISIDEAQERYIKAVSKGMLKVFSKMGISTFQSYCGAQIFDAVGLNDDFIARFFTKTASQIGGIGLDQVAGETIKRHSGAYGNDPLLQKHLEVGGELAWRQRGEAHAWTPETIASLQHAVRKSDRDEYRRYEAAMNGHDKKAMYLRGLFELKGTGQPVPLDEVESIDKICKRFATGAMSFGSISWEAHTNIAIAMNQIGGKSNTGEGG
ncbi:MAG: glutamate synthase subunit alpha, partial [Rhodospirillaceae bacterium]|nr:glutamate synthase subunit alpha [Rhodospirillaceae bacterium]